MNTERRCTDPVGLSATPPPQAAEATTAPAAAPKVSSAEWGEPVGDEARLRVGSVAGLRSLRAGLAHYLEQSGCDPATVSDAQLVLAEIATNAFVHDLAPLVEIRVLCTADEITIGTAHAGEIAPPPYPVPPASFSGTSVSPGGRGLAIVDGVVLSREVASAGGRTTTTVRLRR